MSSDLFALTERLYASALNDEAWVATLRLLCRHLNADGAFFTRMGSTSGAIRDSAAVDLDPEAQREYGAYYGSRDPRLGATKTYATGALITKWQKLDVPRFERGEIYNDFLVRNDSPYILAAWLDRSSAATTSISFQRRRRAGRFEAADLERAAPIIPHLVNSARIRATFDDLHAHAAKAATILEQMRFAFLLLDAQGRVSELSPRAEHLLVRLPAIGLHKSKLRALAQPQDQRLQAAIATVTRAHRRESAWSESIWLRDQDDRSARIRLFTPSVFHWTLPAAIACVVHVHPEDPSTEERASLIQRKLGLPHAEARLAALLDAGRGLQEAAAELGRSLNTVKTQLKSIFVRLHCRSQTGLARAIFAACVLPTPIEFESE